MVEDIQLLQLETKSNNICIQALELADKKEAWDGIYHSSKLVGYSKKIEPADAYKIEAYIEKPPIQVIDYLYSHWQQVRPELMDIIESYTVLKEFNANSRLAVEITNINNQNRELLEFNHKKVLTNGAYALVNVNAEELIDFNLTEHPHGDLKMNVHIAKPIFHRDNLTHFVAVTFFDPKIELTSEEFADLMKTRYNFYKNLIERINNDLR